MGDFFDFHVAAIPSERAILDDGYTVLQDLTTWNISKGKYFEAIPRPNDWFSPRMPYNGDPPRTQEILLTRQQHMCLVAESNIGVRPDQ